MKFAQFLAAGAFSALLAAPLSAQDVPAEAVAAGGPPPTVFDGDFLSVGVGVARLPSYTGSDNYRFQVLPVVQGSLGGVDINPRPAGLALDFIPDPDEGVAFAFGPVFRISGNRDDADDIKDEIVAAYGELDTAIEVGPSVGVKFPRVLNPFDSLSVNLDATWDVAGAHKGMRISPNVTYFTPLSRAVAGALSLGATWIDDDFADYYYTVPAANPALPAADLLPQFDAEGGLQSYGANLLLAADLDGDVTNGGLSLIGIVNYSRLVGDAADTPFTSIRGSADQWLLVAGIGYTF